MMRRLAIRLATITALWLAPSAVHGQELRLEGRTHGRATRVLRQILERQDYLLVTRDTVLPDRFRADGDLVILDADVRLEGWVEGAVAVVRGRFFVRPGARVGGRIASIGGGIYSSGLAQVGDTVKLPYDYRVDVSETGGGYRVSVMPPPPDYLVLPGLYGLRLPTYNRVDGVTLRWGPQLRIFGRDDGALLDPWVSYHSAPGRVGGGATLDIPLGAGYRWVIRVASETRSNDEWIRDEFSNTLAALTLASDRRMYHRSDRIEATLLYRDDTPLLAGEYTVSPRVTYLASRDRSLPGRNPWSLLGDGDDWDPNAPIEEGTLVSVAGGLELRWKGSSTSFVGDLSVERALPAAGDFEFTRWSVEGDWEMDALWTHRIALYAKAFGTFGSDPAPPQRWSFVGGSGTLPTARDFALRGDRLVFIESMYGIPLDSIVVPVLGSPTLEIVHAVGMAGNTGAAFPPWKQNLGLGVAFTLFDVHVYVDPVDRSSPALSAGLSLPGF